MKIKYSDLNIYQVEDFHKDILEDIKLAEELVSLDFTDVETIDLNSIQLILSVEKYCEEKNIKFEVSNINAKKIKKVFKMFNLNLLA